MNLAIDIGNTRIKIGSFQEKRRGDISVFDSEEEALAYVASQPFERAMLCAVGHFTEVKWKSLGVQLLSAQTPLPVQNAYTSPDTLGTDRIAAAIGAHSLFLDRDALAIDCGTCITYDYLTSDAIYRGGGIAPGIDMKFQALHNFTARLPLIKRQERVELIGTNTGSSMLSGVINGTAAEISGIMERYTNISNNLAPVLCGGDASYIAPYLNQPVAVEPHLVLEGINHILLFNA